MLGLFIINSKKLADDFRENIAMTVFFKNEANDTIIKSFDAELKKAPFAKTFEYVSKDAAAKQHTDIIGEDFVTFLGENPLQNSFDIHLKADYVYRDSIAKVESQLRKNPMISDIVYDKQLVNLVNDNIKKVSMWILIISGFFTIIAVLLINSSLRLSIHSNRFIIKTMQMVGATKAFIRKPFVLRSVRLGMIGAGLAILALIGVLIYLESNFPDLGLLDDQLLIALVLISVFALGVLITWLSTYFATQRFLNLRTDDLY
jgi:cell division transport system permease protein